MNFHQENFGLLPETNDFPDYFFSKLVEKNDTPQIPKKIRKLL